ncbi:MAG: type II toxin-antitoxin system Phd/YefM family antitoxin [Kiritimatiellae bacterium]|jgi:PHD/YefM family antitoxin component YafN of YafNO toxin-antitoxin module|nr:type II toxin-antitoxin system Phd/YefM family antitoxin [Kiritimatiellia bacterium]MDD2348935.1 prevent-host-death protein [Kiritimatiellia bacterium]MDD3584275.1 prevent-host-death protein [Kiritimatiellia bacterium]HHU14038.1 prevent-host-death protein [Lentisphaerota bacterium]HON47029.1 prevent-host-death protein [Kiritimatiellia bacterium]
MLTIPAQEVKRRGISAVNDQLQNGPVWIISNNQPKYVVMDSEMFQAMEDELSALRVALSEADIRAGRYTRGSADQLMAELDED